MQQITKRQLGSDVHLTYLSTTRFKASVLSAAVIVPLTAENALAALLPQVLARGTARCPTLSALGTELDSLYGARAFPFVRKVGESLVVGFISDVIDEAYAEPGDDLTSRAIGLIGELWQQPYLTDAGLLCADYTAGERENLADKIAALKNDTRSYAVRRLQEVMCAEEPYGSCEFGTAAGARAITSEELTAFWQDVLAHAPMHLFYCGGASAERVETAFSTAFAKRVGGRKIMQAALCPAPETPRTVIEEANVTQGKLSLGFRTGLTAKDALYPALMLFSVILGGYTGSRLFRHVREKLSLCYYASASLDKLKGVMTVASGIENANFDIARDEILGQLADLQQGGPTEDELEGARRTLLDSLRSMQDSPAGMERFFQSQAVGGLTYDIDTLMNRVADATREDVIAAGQGIRLDTVYFLKGVGQ